MRWLRKSLSVAVMTCCSLSASATEVIFEFGPAIERRLDRLEASELTRERKFRDRWSVAASHSPQIWYAFSSSSERLIPDLREYSLQTLAERMIKHNLEAIGQGDTDNTLIIKVNDLYGGSFRLPSFQGINALVKGEMTLLNGEGQVLFRSDQRVRTHNIYEQVTHYEGNGHPYPPHEFIGSFGAMLSVFLHEKMSDAYPGSNVPAPIAMQRNILTLDKRKNSSKAKQRRLERIVQTTAKKTKVVPPTMPVDFDLDLHVLDRKQH